MAEDNALISRAKSGDEQAFTDLMRAYYGFVYRIVVEIVNNPHDAEEVVQDTFLNVYRGLAQYEERTKFRSWLAKIARNRALNWQREHRTNTVSINEVGEGALQYADSADEHLIRDEQIELIRRAMGTLSQKDRDIARAYYLDGASYAELIRTHGLSYTAISFRLSRAKRTLAKRLQYLLNVAFVPPVISLKKISLGGLTAMKIGTAPKITVGAIAIIALVFIGLHQLKSPEENLSLSERVVESMPNESIHSVAQTDNARKSTAVTSLSEDKPQISTEEMEQIEDFFAQLEADDTQSNTGQLAEAEFRQDADERVADNAAALTEITEQSAEEVMNAFLEAFRILDRDAIRPLLTAEMRKRTDFLAPVEFSVEITEIRVEERDGTEGVEHLGRVEDEEEARHQLEQLMLEPVLKMVSQAEVVSSGHVGSEFHFRLGMPAPEMPVPNKEAVIETEMPPPPETLVKMHKEDDTWLIYDHETLD